MNTAYKPITPRARLLSAGTAVLSATAVVCAVVALAGHYDEEYLQVAHAQTAAAAQHAQASAQASAQVPALQAPGLHAAAHG